LIQALTAVKPVITVRQKLAIRHGLTSWACCYE